MGVEIRKWIGWLFFEQISGIYFSDIAIVLLIAAVVSFLPGYILVIKKKTSFRKIFLVFITIVYAGCMLLITIIRRGFGSSDRVIYLKVDLGIDYMGIYSPMQFVYSVFNFVLFLFWGIITGIYRISQDPLTLISMTTLIGFITSFSIEFTQLLTRSGRFEFTDLLTNVFGALCGAICVFLWKIIFMRKSGNEQNKNQ